MKLFFTLVLGIFSFVSIAKADEQKIIAIQQAEINRLNSEVEKLSSRSCFNIKQRNPAAKNGIFRIYPVSVDSGLDVYCNMEENGGGWTLVWKVGDSNSVLDRESQTQKLRNPEIESGVAKFSDELVNRIRSNYAEDENGYWIENLAGNCSGITKGGFISAACVFEMKKGGVPRTSACSKARATYNGTWFDDSYTQWCQQTTAEGSSYFCSSNVSSPVVLRTFLPGNADVCMHSYKNTRVWVR